MRNNVIPTVIFEKRFKRFSKKFNSLSEEIAQLEKELMANPKMGESLGAGLFKVRLASKDKGKGKSGGFRVITYLIDETNTGTDIYLIIIYDKSEENSISKSQLMDLVKKVFK